MMYSMHPAARAFTLVETLVAISILMIAISGPYIAVQRATSVSYNARDQLIASSLAQEGAEYVRSIRDDNYLRNNQSPGSRTWLASLDGTQGGTASYADCYSSACTVDPSQQTVAACGANGACPPLYLSPSNIYNQNMSGIGTKFTRKVQLTSVSATETLVTVTVSYTSGHGTYTVAINDTLSNWL